MAASFDDRVQRLTTIEIPGLDYWFEAARHFLPLDDRMSQVPFSYLSPRFLEFFGRKVVAPDLPQKLDISRLLRPTSPRDLSAAISDVSLWVGTIWPIWWLISRQPEGQSGRLLLKPQRYGTDELRPVHHCSIWIPGGSQLVSFHQDVQGWRMDAPTDDDHPLGVNSLVFTRHKD